MNANDIRKLTDGIITWHEDEASGRGYLTVNFDDGGFDPIVSWRRL